MTQPNLQSKVVKTACGQCYVGCGIKVTLESGVVVGVEGNPDNPQNRGMMCAKGKAGVMAPYNPNRVKAPLKRTNPEKGLDVDPGWQEISWDEAFGAIVAALERIRDDPKKLWVHGWDAVGDNIFWLTAFGSAFGTPHSNNAGSPTCGKVVHQVEYFSGGGFHQAPDLHYADYCILIGTQFGFAARGSFNHNLLDMADARARGMKVVVVDPVGAHAGSKANEWIPIRPGTDGAMALSMLHVLLNELGIFDAAFLKHKTNAPYLVGADGRYVRHPESKEPQVHDLWDGLIKAHNDSRLRDPAIKGSYRAQDRPARTAFELLCEHVAKYPPEKTESITTIPASTVRRIAREFGEAARIGQTITIDGVELPLRPVCVDWAKGSQGHKHGFHNCWPLKLLNMVVGAVNVPGGILSTGAAGDHPHHWRPKGGLDGMLEDGGQILKKPHAKAFPGRNPSPPVRTDIGELFPLASHFHVLQAITVKDPQAYGLDYGIEVLLHTPVNALLSSFGDIKDVERLYRSLEFMAGFAVEINETNLFDDIVLPFPSHLERYDFVTGLATTTIPPCGEHDFYWQVRHPVLDPPPDVRHPQDVIMEIAERVGVLKDLYRIMSHTFALKEDYVLKGDKRYPIAEIIDREARSWFGDEHGLAWFKENGVIRFPRSVQENYFGPFLEARVPIYLEHFLDRRDELQEVLAKLGLEWDLSDYTPISEWLPCPSYEAIRKGDYDLIAVHYKLPYIYGAFANENPWIDELCEATGAYRILVNDAVAKAKGIADGDSVWIESPVCKLRAVAKLTQCIHPEALGVAGHFGHFAPGMPVARGKGVNFNSLCPSDMEHVDMISTALDHCVEVKLYK